METRDKLHERSLTTEATLSPKLPKMEVQSSNIVFIDKIIRTIIYTPLRDPHDSRDSTSHSKEDCPRKLKWGIRYTL